MNRLRIVLGLVFFASIPLAARAQNNTPATAAIYAIGQGFVNVNVAAAPPNNFRWYHFGVVGGRSYCVEQVNEKTPTVSPDGYVEVRQGDGVTVIGSGDDVVGPAEEPGFDQVAATPARFCYIAPASSQNYALVGNCCGTTTGTIAHNYQFRVVETTLFCPWFFSGNGFEAFILIRNTTNATLTATVRLRSPTGVLLGTQTDTVTPNGSYNLQVSAPSPGGFGLTNVSGSVEIAFAGLAVPNAAMVGVAGAPGSLLANVTSLSFAQGVSFDAPMAPRQDWQR